MRIAIINHIYLDKDLCKTSQLSTITSLKKMKHEVDFIVPDSNLIHKKEQDIIKINTFSKNSFISSPLFNLFLLIYLPFYLIIKKPDFILFDSLSLIGLIPYILLSKLKIIKTKFIFVILSHPVSDNTFIDKLRIYQYIFSLKLHYLYSGVIFLTQSMGIEQCNKYKIKLNSFGIWNSGVDKDKFDPKKYEESGKELRKKFHLENKIILIYHGVFAPHRGLRRMVNSFSIIIKKYPQIVLFLLGEGEVKKDLEKIIKKKNLEKNIILFGPVDHNEVPKYISMADVGIIPLPNHYFWNTQSPLKLLEYLSMEKPLIITDIPAHKEVIKNNPLAFYISHPNEIEFLRAIEKVISNKKQLKFLGRDGRKIILKDYTWDNITKNLIKYLNSFLNNNETIKTKKERKKAK
jgi:glycosyltransferase involved in cell wall biosynthesis